MFSVKSLFLINFNSCGRIFSKIEDKGWSKDKENTHKNIIIIKELHLIKFEELNEKTDKIHSK